MARDPEAGVIGPAILNLPAVGPSLGLTGSDLHLPITNERLTRLGRRLREEKVWFHLGTHPDWRAVYIDELRVERLLMRHAGADVDPFSAMNHQDPAIRAAVAGGASPVDPGVERRRLLPSVPP